MFIAKLKYYFNKFWYIVATILLVVLWIFAHKRTNKLADIVDFKTEANEKVLRERRKNLEKEEKEKVDNKIKYENTMRRLEKNYQVNTKEISRKKKKRIKELVAEYKNDPKKFAVMFAEEMNYLPEEGRYENLLD
jgi:hypothetical protein